MDLELSRPLPDLVKEQYDSAKSSNALTFSASELSIVSMSGIPFQLRYCPSLAKKPEPEKDASSGVHRAPDENGTKTKNSDPFDNPPPDLFMTNAPEYNAAHFLVLNKFPIIAHHFILATLDRSKKQSHALDEADLAVTLACLHAWEQSPPAAAGAGGQRRLFAFFNSGRWSGASQPHRHVQFLPLEAMQADDVDNSNHKDNDDDGGDNEAASWTPLIDAITHGAASVPVASLADPVPDSPQLYAHADLPVYHYAVRFDCSRGGPASAAELHAAYRALAAASAAAVARFIEYHPNSLALHAAVDDETGAPDPRRLPFSYNLGMTTRGMVMLPRRRAGVMVDLAKEADGPQALASLGSGGGGGGGKVVDLAAEVDRATQAFCAVNGAVLAGTVMVREAALWGALRDGGEGPRRLSRVLEGVAIPRGRIEAVGSL